MQQLPDESIRQYWGRFSYVIDDIPNYQDSNVIAAFQHGCKYPGISNALTRRCMHTLPKLSNLVSKSCNVEDVRLARKKTDSICDNKSKRNKPTRRHESIACPHQSTSLGKKENHRPIWDNPRQLSGQSMPGTLCPIKFLPHSQPSRLLGNQTSGEGRPNHP